MQGHDQEGLVYADLDISRQQRTQITNRESMEELNGVGMSAHSSPIMVCDYCLQKLIVTCLSYVYTLQ